MKKFLLALAFFALAVSGSAQVAFDAASESHTGTSGSTSETSFSWEHTPAGTPRGVICFIHGDNQEVPGTVTYGGTTLPPVAAAQANDTSGEDMQTTTVFLGSSVPTGAQTVVVNRTNNGNEMYSVCFTVTAGGNTEIYEAGIVLLEEDGIWTEQDVDDGSPGTNSLRVAYCASGRNNPPPAGANTTAGPDLDNNVRAQSSGYETTPGQGSRPVGCDDATSDDRAGVHLAIREVGGAPAPASKLMLMGVGE